MTISTASFRLFSPLMMLADAAAHGGYSSTNVISANAAAGVGSDADSAARMLP